MDVTDFGGETITLDDLPSFSMDSNEEFIGEASPAVPGAPADTPSPASAGQSHGPEVQPLSPLRPRQIFACWVYQEQLYRRGMYHRLGYCCDACVDVKSICG